MCLINILKIDSRTVVQNTTFWPPSWKKIENLKNPKPVVFWYQIVENFMLKTNMQSLYKKKIIGR